MCDEAKVAIVAIITMTLLYVVIFLSVDVVVNHGETEVVGNERSVVVESEDNRKRRYPAEGVVE